MTECILAIFGTLSKRFPCIAGIDYDSFASNDMLIDAVVRNLEIIGEAANHLSSEFCQTHDQIKWRNIIDMRNLLIHNYAGVNIKVVWDTCTIDLPGLKSQLDSDL